MSRIYPTPSFHYYRLLPVLFHLSPRPQAPLLHYMEAHPWHNIILSINILYHQGPFKQKWWQYHYYIRTPQDLQFLNIKYSARVDILNVSWMSEMGCFVITRLSQNPNKSLTIQLLNNEGRVSLPSLLSWSFKKVQKLYLKKLLFLSPPPWLLAMCCSASRLSSVIFIECRELKLEFKLSHFVTWYEFWSKLLRA